MNTMTSARKWILQKHFQGLPRRSDVEIVEFELPPIQDGSVLLKAVYLSVDPYVRLFQSKFPEGSTLIGEQIARVIESKNADLPVGTMVLASTGWVTHSVSDGTNLTKIPSYPEGVPLSLALGILGMTGFTANYGMLHICCPKPGEVVLVNSAAGAVGSVAGQIAKILDCKVIGFAGTDKKVAWLKELGFDEAFNYKKIHDLDVTLKCVAPNGIDCYFDNVGGEFSCTVLANMAQCGRIACCGMISSYNNTKPKMLPDVFSLVNLKELKMQGFEIETQRQRFPEIMEEHLEWIKQGRLKYKEHVTQGFDNMFDAFMGLFSGENTGKAIVEV